MTSHNNFEDVFEKFTKLLQNLILLIKLNIFEINVHMQNLYHKFILCIMCSFVGKKYHKI